MPKRQVPEVEEGAADASWGILCGRNSENRARASFPEKISTDQETASVPTFRKDQFPGAEIWEERILGTNPKALRPATEIRVEGSQLSEGSRKQAFSVGGMVASSTKSTTACDVGQFRSASGTWWSCFAKDCVMSRNRKLGRRKVGTVVNLELPEGLVTVVFPEGLNVEQTFGLTAELQRCRGFLAVSAVVKSWEKKTHQTARVHVPPAKSILRRAA